MRLLINEPSETGVPAAGEELINMMHEAAEIALRGEGIDPDWIEISLSFVSAEEIRELNREHRGIDRVTDVLSFPLVEDLSELIWLEDDVPDPDERDEDEDDVPDEDPDLFEDDIDDFPDILELREVNDTNEDMLDEGWTEPLGDVVICLEQAEAQAKEYGHSREREIVYLFVHSVLHLLGYDHMEPEEQRQMRAREEEIMAAMALTREQ